MAQVKALVHPGIDLNHFQSNFETLLASFRLDRLVGN